jgi:hypothetical protein
VGTGAVDGVALDSLNNAQNTVVPFILRGNPVYINDGTATSTFSGGNLSVTGSINSGTLTSGGVIYVGASGLLQDSTNLTYNGTSLGIGVSGANSIAVNIATAAATPNLYAWKITGSTTRSNGGYIANTTGKLYLGVEGQYGGGSSDYFASGDGAYDAVIAYANGLSLGQYNGAVSMRITSTGNIYGTSGTTGMTNGFFYIPSSSGAPSGTPTAISGNVPMYYDSTNNNFYVYNGAWKKVTLS